MQTLQPPTALTYIRSPFWTEPIAHVGKRRVTMRVPERYPSVTSAADIGRWVDHQVRVTADALAANGCHGETAADCCYELARSANSMSMSSAFSGVGCCE
eukprot:8702234-Pyramimonas_sp.AAC.1